MLNFKSVIFIAFSYTVRLEYFGGAYLETVKLGSTGASVELLQLSLQRSGFYENEIDGIFDQKTQDAVMDFQRSVKIPADGIVGIKAWQALMPFIKGYVKQIIKIGDSFWSLSQKHNTSVRSISIANPNLDPLNLSVGTQIIIPLGFDLVPTNIKFTYSLMQYVIEGLIARYPFIKKGSVGKSIMGKDLTLLQIGNGQTQVFYNAAHHANEWINSPLLLKFLEEYSKAYGSGGRIYDMSAIALFSTTALSIIPMVDPDGVDLVLDVIPKDSEYYIKAVRLSKGYPDIPFPSGWKANIKGVDLNLNYPANWKDAKKIKYDLGFTKPGPRDFVGAAPLSEPESRAIYDFTLNNDFSLIIAYHTQGEIIFWRYLDFEPKYAKEIGEKFSDSSGYPLEDTPASSSFAGYRDWFIQNYNRPGYTIETGKGKSPVPISQFDKIYRDNLGILSLGLSESLLL